MKDERFATIPASVQQALASTDSFYDELLIGEIKPDVVDKVGRLPNGANLSEILPQDVVGRLWSFASRHHLAFRQLEQFKPWMICIVVQDSLKRVRIGPKAVGLEDQLQARARLLGKRIGTLETPDDQLAPLDSLPLDEQVQLIRHALDESEGNLPIRQIGSPDISVFLAGDEQAILRSIQSDDEADVIYVKAMVLGRNVKLANRILERIKRGPALFAVGAAHAVGPGSVIEWLRGAGKVVTRISTAHSDNH